MRVLIRISSNRVAGKERSVEATVTEARDDTDRWMKIQLHDPSTGKELTEVVLLHIIGQQLFIEFQNRQEIHVLEELA